MKTVAKLANPFWSKKNTPKALDKKGKPIDPSELSPSNYPASSRYTQYRITSIDVRALLGRIFKLFFFF
jgi:hypothetical protein